jgi:uncharacterized protein (TIGR02271 family)
MNTRTITAIYDSEADARNARERLVRAGIDDDDVRIVSQQLSGSPVSSDAGASDKGMWESIKDFFVGHEDRPAYSEGLRRGGYLLTARVDDEHSDQAIGELEQTNAIDLDERSAQWRSEGWSAASAAGMEPRTGTGTSTSTSTSTSEGFTAGDATSMRDASASSDEQAIPIVEERLRVGKREVDRGTVRVRSYIVEEPVHEDVSLREERVEVERRPVGDRDMRADAGMLQERTIEISERGEEPVVAKDAVVTEEVVVRKAEDERVENIDETVRRTEVEVDDPQKTSGGGRRTGGAAGGTPSKRAR